MTGYMMLYCANAIIRTSYLIFVVTVGLYIVHCNNVYINCKNIVKFDYAKRQL